MFGVICNQCTSVCTDDTTAARWWRLARNFEGVGSGGVGIIESLASAVSASVDVSLELADELLAVDAEEPDTVTIEDDRTEFDDDDPVLHFCSTSCLAEWAATAAAIEPDGPTQ